MVRHDAKALAKRGQAPGGYVPRAQHPILDEMQEKEEAENSMNADDAGSPPTEEPARRTIVAAEEPEEPGTDNNQED
jgi:hypothetical protein